MTNAFDEVKKAIDSGMMVGDLASYLQTKLVVNTNAQEMFVNAYVPLELSSKGKEIIEARCQEQLEFVYKIE